MEDRKQIEVPIEKIEAQEEYIEQIHRWNEDGFHVVLLKSLDRPFNSQFLVL